MNVNYMFSDTLKHFSDDFLVARAAKCANSFEKRFPTKGDEAQKRAKMLTTEPSHRASKEQLTLQANHR